MDEWVSTDRIEKFPSEGNRLEKEKKKADEINQILNDGHSNNSSALLEYRDPPARKRQRPEGSFLEGKGKGKGKENTPPLPFDDVSFSPSEEIAPSTAHSAKTGET